MGSPDKYPYRRRTQTLAHLVLGLVSYVPLVAIGVLLYLHPKVPGFIKVAVLVSAALTAAVAAYGLTLWRSPRFRAAAQRFFQRGAPAYLTLYLKLMACTMVFIIATNVLMLPIWFLAALPEAPDWVGFLVAVPTVLLAVLGGLWSAHRMYRAEIWRSVRTYLEEHYRALWK